MIRVQHQFVTNPQLTMPPKNTGHLKLKRASVRKRKVASPSDVLKQAIITQAWNVEVDLGINSDDIGCAFLETRFIGEVFTNQSSISDH